MANVVEIILRGTDQLTGPFTRAGANFQRQMAALGTAAAGFATVAAGSLTALTVSAINAADEMGHMAQRIGIPVEALSRLAHAANLSNVSTAQLETGLKQLARTLQEAASDPASEAARVFVAMGVAIKDAAGNILPLEQVILSLSDKFRSYKDTAEQTALALKLFGKSGTEMIPLLNEGAEAIRAMGREANVVTEDMGRQAAALKDNIDRLKNVLAGLGFSIAQSILPTITKLSFHLADTAVSARQAHGEITALASVVKALASAYLIAAAGAESFGLIYQGAKSGMDHRDLMQMLRDLGKETKAAFDDIWSGSRKALTPPMEAPTGTGDEIAPVLDKEVQAAQKRYDTLLEMAQRFNAQNVQEWQRGVAARIQAEERGKQAVIGLTGSMFGTLSRLAAVYGGKNFALQQAFQIGQAIMNTALGVTRAYAEHAWPYSTIVASLVAALGAAEIAIIAGAKPGGQAHAGMTNVPVDGSWYLQGGERVIPSEQNTDLTEFLASQSNRPIHVSVDGHELFRLLWEAGRDGRLTIPARAIA